MQVFFFPETHLRYNHFSFKDTVAVKMVITLHLICYSNILINISAFINFIPHATAETIFLKYIVIILFLCLKTCRRLQSVFTLILNSYWRESLLTRPFSIMLPHHLFSLECIFCVKQTCLLPQLLSPVSEFWHKFAFLCFPKNVFLISF